MTDAIIEQINFLDGNKTARTRLVYLQRFMEIGAEVDPRVDLAPMSRQTVDR